MCYLHWNFHKKRHIEKHISKVHDGIRIRCDICFSNFTEKLGLKTHIEAIHKENKPYKCDICDVNFAERVNYKKHVKSVHEGVTHKCNICDKIFTQNAHLTRHISKFH